MLNKLLMLTSKRVAQTWDEDTLKNKKIPFLFSCLTVLFLMITLWVTRGQVAYGQSVFSQYLYQYSNRPNDALLIAQVPGSAQVPRSIDDLTGRWTCDDGGIYFVRQIENMLWWYGGSADAGATWSNIFWGNIQGNQINGQWADVPKGKASSGGEMSLVLESAFTLKAVSKTGGFGGSTWSRN
jgi:hypothetical protein